MKLKKIDLNAMMEVSFIFAFPILESFYIFGKGVHVVVYVFLLFVTFCIFGMFPVFTKYKVKLTEKPMRGCPFVPSLMLEKHNLSELHFYIETE